MSLLLFCYWMFYSFGSQSPWLCHVLATFSEVWAVMASIDAWLCFRWFLEFKYCHNFESYYHFNGICTFLIFHCIFYRWYIFEFYRRIYVIEYICLINEMIVSFVIYIGINIIVYIVEFISVRNLKCSSLFLTIYDGIILIYDQNK